jgi:hypothetical protein
MPGHLLNSLDAVSLLDIAGTRSIQKETRARFPPRPRYERGYEALRFGSGQRNRKRAMTVRADATQQVFQNPNDIFPSAMSRHFSVRQPSCNRSCPPVTSGRKPWMKHVGKLKDLHKETQRINRMIEETFEVVDSEMWASEMSD